MVEFQVAKRRPSNSRPSLSINNSNRDILRASHQNAPLEETTSILNQDLLSRLKPENSFLTATSFKDCFTARQNGHDNGSQEQEGTNAFVNSKNNKITRKSTFNSGNKMAQLVMNQTTVGFRNTSLRLNNKNSRNRSQSGRKNQTQTNFYTAKHQNQKNNHNFKQFEDPEDTFGRTTISLRKMTAKKGQFFDDIVAEQDCIKDYQIIGQIGKGSFSKVLSAFDSSKNLVAIKIYEKVSGLDWHRLESIKKQIKSLEKLDHENVVRLHRVVKDKNKLYLVMDNCGKQTLAGILRKAKGLEEADLKRYFKQVVEGVQHFHQRGVCHRDLKPENILIDNKGHLKVIDFGFSSIGKPYLTSYCGTPPFMCPQIVQKRPYSGIKADIWALGVMLFLMTNGKLPFRATTEQELYRLIGAGNFTFYESCKSQQVKRLIKKMLKVQPQERISAQQVLNDKWLRGV